jgi:beta-lactamase class D
MLPVSLHSHSMTKNIIFLEELQNGWKLYGKTGTGYLLKNNRTERSSIMHGWFVGWAEKDNQKILFATHITDDKEQNISPSQRARTYSKEKLKAILDNSN